MTTVPRISGCYIVKDEEERLGSSLRAIAPFVDEVVVYDTGSTDRTREIAREHGARVVEGFWDEDFGAARNRALQHCRGTWVLCVDADEVPTGNPAAWRRELRGTSADLVLMEVVSQSWEGAGEESRVAVPRAFRRSRGRWSGALHEQVIARHPGPFPVGWTAHVVLQHSGYDAVVISRRGKLERNERIARKALEEAQARGEQRLGTLRVNLARSAYSSGNLREALAQMRAVDRSELTPPEGITAGHVTIDTALRLEELDTAREWLAAVRSWGEGEQLCRSLEGRVALVAGDLEGAEELLRSVVDGVDHRGLRFDASSCKDYLVQCLLQQDRVTEAAELLLEHVASGRSATKSAVVVEVAGRLDGGVRRLAEVLPVELVKPFVGQMGAGPAEASDAFFEELWAAGREQRMVALTASRQWRTLQVERALVWSMRLREDGLAEHCPLRRAVADEECDLERRVLCGALLVEVGELDVLEVLEPLLGRITDEQAPALLARMSSLTPGFAASLVPA